MIQTANDIFVLHTAHTTMRSANCRQGSWSIYIMEEKSMCVSLWMKMQSHL